MQVAVRVFFRLGRDVIGLEREVRKRDRDLPRPVPRNILAQERLGTGQLHQILQNA